MRQHVAPIKVRVSTRQVLLSGQRWPLRHERRAGPPRKNGRRLTGIRCRLTRGG